MSWFSFPCFTYFLYFQTAKYIKYQQLKIAKVEDRKKGKKGKKRSKSHEHSQSQKSFSGFAQFTTAIAMMRSKPQSRSAYAAYTDAKSKSIKKSVTFNPDAPTESKSLDDMKENYHSNRNLHDQSRRDSIWDGVLDVNNIIMVPETPKWRPRFSFQQNQLLQEGLLDSILAQLSPKGYHKSIQGTNTDQLGLADEVQVTSVDAMCLFLPFLCVVSSKLSSTASRDELQLAILQRTMKEVDVKQHFEFFLNSYKDAPELRKQFNKANSALIMKKQTSVSSNNNNPNSVTNSPQSDMTPISPYFGSAGTISNDTSTMDDLLIFFFFFCCLSIKICIFPYFCFC